MFATMTKKFVWVAALMGLALTSVVHAETKIAVVDFNRVFSEWNVTKTTLTALPGEFISRQRDLEAKDKELKIKGERLQKDGAVMSESERSGLQKEIAKADRDLKSQAQALNEDFEARRNEEVSRLQNQLFTEVQSFCKNNGYDVVLFNNAVVYVRDSMDITNQVLTYLQGRSPEVKPAAPAANKPATPAPATKPAK